jgi:hypothetical protein
MNPGDEVLWAALNGNVRTGRLLEWFPDTSRWFVEIYPASPDKRDQGFRTWIKPAALIRAAG